MANMEPSRELCPPIMSQSSAPFGPKKKEKKKNCNKKTVKSDSCELKFVFLFLFFMVF